MAVSFSLTPSEIAKKAKDKGYKFLSDNLLSPTIKNGLPEKTFMLGDNNWNGSQPWMIKISKKNFTYINKKSPFYTSGISSVVKKEEATYTIPSNGKKNIQVKFVVKDQTKTNTADQERGSTIIFGQALNKNKDFNSIDDIISDKDTLRQLVKTFKGDVPFDWLTSYYAQQKVLLDEVKPRNKSKFNRDGGFMDFVTKLIAEKFKIKKKDNWDPADIWVISGDERQYINKIKDSLEGPHQTISELNKILRGYFKSKEVMGISLKKTGNVAYYEEVNLSGVIRDTTTDNFDVPMTDFIALFNIEPKTGMFTQDVKIKVDDPDTKKTFTFQIKANSSNSKTGSNLKFEPTMKGASAARLGKAPVDDVCEILKYIKSGAKFVNDYSKYPATALDFKTHPKGESYFRNTVLPALVKGGSKITTDVSNIDNIISNIQESYNSSMDRTTNTRCKLMGLDFFYQVSKLTENQRNEFVTDMVYLAQKKAFGKRKDFGPFGKIF